MNSFFVNLKENKSVTITLVIFFVLSSVFAYLNLLGAKDFWINLSAGLVGSFLTIIIIDYLQDQRRKLKFKNAEEITNKELNDLSILTINWIASRFGIKFKDYYNGDANKSIEKVYKTFCSLDKNKIIQKFNFEDWKNLLMYLFYIKSSIDESISVYKDHISGTLLGSLFKLRSDFRAMHWTFGLIHAGWVIDKKSPPQTLLDQLINELKKVIDSANDLMKITKK